MKRGSAKQPLIAQSPHAEKSVAEREKVDRVLKDLGLAQIRDIALIDACPDNKPSASKARSIDLAQAGAACGWFVACSSAHASA